MSNNHGKLVTPKLSLCSISLPIRDTEPTSKDADICKDNLTSAMVSLADRTVHDTSTRCMCLVRLRVAQHLRLG